MHTWKNIDEIFITLNEANVSYVVLRNWENFLYNFYLDAHPDIDLLVDNREKTISALKAMPREKKSEKMHQKILIDNREVQVDIRTIGDGYYDGNWEKEMIEKRIMYNNFYVLDKENYYYSLLYHALIQKWKMSEDYKEKLNKMRIELNLTTPPDIKSLEKFMKEKGYQYTWQEFSRGIFNIKEVDRKLLENNIRRSIPYIINSYLYIIKKHG